MIKYHQSPSEHIFLKREIYGGSVSETLNLNA